MSAGRSRIFLVEDEELTRVGIRHHLEDRFDIVGEADNVADAVALIRERQPDLVLLDIEITRGASGVDVVEQVRHTHPKIRFLVFTASISRSDVVRLFSVGVDGYLTKSPVDGGDLADLVDKTLQGGRLISSQVARSLFDIDEITALFTPREREIVVLIARGYTYREAAKHLGIEVKTVENHMTSIFGKAGQGYQGPSEGGSAGVREPRSPYPPVDSAAAAADPDHGATGPTPA